MDLFSGEMCLLSATADAIYTVHGEQKGITTIQYSKTIHA